MLADAVVNAFVMTAENNEILLKRQVIGLFLTELSAIGRRVDDLVVMALTGQMTDDVEHRFNADDHAGFAAEGVVVHAPVLVGRVVAQVVDLQVDDALRAGPADDRMAERALQQFRKNGYDIDPQHAAI